MVQGRLAPTLIHSLLILSAALGPSILYAEDTGSVQMKDSAMPEDAAEQDELGGDATQPLETWGGFYDPGAGALVVRNENGELAISAYMLLRYLNQTPSDQTFTDHLGNVREVDTRSDIFPHRLLVFLKGWLGTPKFIYNITFWTVNATDQDALLGTLGYQFNKKFSLYAGVTGNPGTRSLFGSHPYWLGHDRVMADEFFRPYFTWGAWVTGEITPGLWYNTTVGNTSSNLGITARELDRRFTYGGSLWWMPTTGEFGPRGAYGDWEMHQELATRFGISAVKSPEQRFTESDGTPGNTILRLADSVNLFETGALAPGTTVQKADYRILALDAGLKYKGFFLQAEFYRRWLDEFDVDGLLPVDDIVDEGFYVQSAFFPIPKKLELYLSTSQIYGDTGFDDSSEYIIGANYYIGNTRNYRLNFQVIDVNDSPVDSTFGYYTGGQDGTTYSIGASIFF